MQPAWGHGGQWQHLGFQAVAGIPIKNPVALKREVLISQIINNANKTQKNKMKTKQSIHSVLMSCMGTCALLGVMVANQAQGATLRYQQSGDYFLVGNPGWQAGGGGAGGVPGAADITRYNWGNNTVTLAAAAPNITRFEMGVDESGGLVVNSGGSLTLTGDGRVGNNAGGGGANLTTGFLRACLKSHE